MTNPPGRPLIVVLGMHRSGTSLCANVLAALGIDMAEAAAPSPANPRGHWERARINDLNDEVFALYGARWSDAGHDLALPQDWWKGDGVATIARGLAATLTPLLATPKAAGFKDPRTARLLPMWDSVFDALGVEPRFVFCVRDPSEVARSLEARDRTARTQAEYRWLVYNAHAVHGVRDRPICTIPYDDWFDAPLATVRRLAAWVLPHQTFSDSQLAELVGATVDAGLRHGQPGARPPATPAARRLHAAIADAAAHTHFSTNLQRMAEDFLDFEQAVTPLLREAVILKASVREQNRVIGDLQDAIRQSRKG